MTIDTTRLGQAAGQFGQLDNKVRRNPSGDSTGQVAEGMGKLLNEAVEKLDQSQKAADEGIASLVAGEPVDLHHVMLQMEQSMIDMNLALQVRNKVIEAYQEVQRIQL